MSIINRSYGNSLKVKSLRSSSGLYSKFISQSLTYKKLFRQFPLLAAIHRFVDGVLLGLVLIVVFMSIISLHARHLWTLSFSRLEASRNLIHRLKESISILETNFLASQNLSNFMIETKTSHLLYLDSPDDNRRLIKNDLNKNSLLDKFVFHLSSHGY